MQLITYCHVRPAACVSGLGYGVHQLAADAKIAQFDIPLSVHKNVGRFDVCEHSKGQPNYNVTGARVN